MSRLLPRAALALVAALLTAWFATLAWSDRIGTEGRERLFEQPEMSAADYERSLDQLRRAEWLNPGTEWSVLRAGYLLRRDRRRALSVAESVVRAEPDNLAAWAIVSRATAGVDPRRSARARAEIRRLSPPLADE